MNEGGREAMLYALQRWNFSHINLRKIPRTKALFDQQYNSMSTVEKFWFEKLQDGILIPNQTTWEIPVPFPVIYDEYKKFASGIKDWNPIPRNQFGSELRKLCRDIRETKPNVNGVRTIHKTFPPLEKCRQQFENLFQCEGVIKWEQDVVSPYG